MDKREAFLQSLQNYLDNKITSEEQDGLMQVILEGTYDSDLNSYIDQLLKDDTCVGEMDKIRAREILHNILTAGKENVGRVPKQRFIKKYSYWISAAAASLLIAIVVAGGIIYRGNPGEKSLISGNEAQKPPEPGLFTGKQYVKLPDGSSVFLNENSELSYDAEFGQLTREVKLTGEGYFDIQHDISRPFLVRTGELTITVLGTAFNVKAYPTDIEIQVAVTRGRVTVSRDDKSFGVIAPDEQIVVNTVTNEFVQSKADAESVSSWKNQYLILDNLSMEEAMQQVGEKYNVAITFADKSLKKYRVTATFLNGENLEHVLTVVCGVIDATYLIDEQGNILINEK